MAKESDVKVLIVDDEPGNIFYLKRLLKYQGYEIISAENGREALQKVVEESPDVVLLDIMMPEITGIDVLDQIMADEKTKDIPVIMCTAKTDSASVELTLSKGATEYVRKPIDDTELLARMRTVLRVKKHEDKLKQMVKSKEEFIRMVSHDLRTPFASISGFAELLKSDETLAKSFSDEHIEFLNYIINSSNFLVDYFNKLLNWAQQDSEEFKINKASVSLEKLVDISIVFFNSKMELKGITVQKEIEKGIDILVDEVYFGQVINNLLGNALKYTISGGTITVAAFTIDSGIKFSVKDSGVGMSAELIERILKDEAVSSSPGTEREKGTGLGLQICKKIIAAHGFTLKIESEPNQGTEMIIEIN